MKLTAIVEIYNSPKMTQHLIISAHLMKHSSDSRLENTKNAPTFVGMQVIKESVDAKKTLHLISWDKSTSTLSESCSIEQDFTLSHPTSDLGGAPIGLMDYYTSCSPQPQNPTILAISIATTFRNTHAGSNVTLSLRWHPPATAPPSDDVYKYSAANMPRFSLVGFIEPIPTSEVLSHDVEACFLDRHPDAEAWLPGNKIHQSWWGRLVVKEVYWFFSFFSFYV